MSASAVNGISSLEDKIQQRINSPANTLETIPSANHHQGKIPNTPAASSTIAFCLGGLFSFGLYTAVLDAFSKPFQTPYQLGLYLAAWAFFHWAEFTVTAAWNLEKCSVDSYLLENGSMYHFAHTAAIVEFLVSRYFTPSFKSFPYVSQVGIMLVIFGQVLRSMGMIHASTNFSHAVALQKRVGHKLVTNKIYAWVRHPSYAGFFYWALGTQLLLQNPLSLLFFCVVLWRFFYYRIRGEEAALIRFFGEEYKTYRQRVGTKIPFIP